MASEHNRLRRKWQHYSGRNARIAEADFFSAFQDFFEDTDFRIRSKPKEFSTAYVGFDLSSEVLSEIYNPSDPITKHGVFPDYAIDNIVTNKTIYVEVKRQDGWVEGGKRADGRGNAHERSCKFFTPGLLQLLREKGNISSEYLPFWTVLVGNIARDPCRVREVSFWYQGYENHFFFWRDANNPTPLVEHFVENLEIVLE
jgi:hypothetical protein